MTISLSDLKAKRAAMTQGEWKRRPWPEFGVDGPEYPVCTVNSDDDRRPLLNEDKAMCDSEDVEGIVATHNAADALIAIVEAAMAYEAAVVTFRASADRDDRPVFEGHRHRMNLAHDVLTAALAKVRP